MSVPGSDESLDPAFLFVGFDSIDVEIHPKPPGTI
jgi:hypothetical protein